jgi:hypothetical protein
MGFGILFLASSSVPVAVSRDILCIVCLGEIFVFCAVCRRPLCFSCYLHFDRCEGNDVNDGKISRCSFF